MSPAQARKEVSELLRAAEKADHPRLGVQLVRSRMNELQARGATVPQDLIAAEKRFLEDCIAESQGR
jgi:hypothetical protein